MTATCPACQLVNFADAPVCRRCQTPLGSYGVPWQGGAYGDPRGGQYGEGQSAGPYPGGNAPQYGAQPYGPPRYGDGAYPPYNQQEFPGYGAPAYNAVGYGYAARPVYALAGRGSRLGAQFLDGCSFLVPIALLAVGGILGGRSGSGAIGAVMLGLLSLITVIAVQLVMLSSRGQTIGKRIVGVRIVKHDTGENGGFVTNVLMRGLVPNLIAMIPVAGVVFSIVDILFVFREDRRCIHDLIAGTVVVEA